MWIVLPTKGCACGTCEKLREAIDEDGAIKLGTVYETPSFKSHALEIPNCSSCGKPMALCEWERLDGPPGNGWRCFTCNPELAAQFPSHPRAAR